MYIAQIVIMTVILSYLSMTSSFLTTSSLDIVKSQKQTNDMMIISSGVTSYYDETGALPSNFTDILPYLIYATTNGWKDADGADFEIVTNGGAVFSYSGVNTYLAAIVAPGKDGLDSTITSGTLIVNNNEDVFLIPRGVIDSGFRGQTQESISYCNGAITLFSDANGGALPTGVPDLTTGGFLNSIFAFDGLGNLLRVSGGVCYSVGFNETDESGAGDDIS